MINFLPVIPDTLIRHGIRIPAWYDLLVAMLGILSGCLSLRDLKWFAMRRHPALISPLGMELRRPPSPSDSAFRYSFQPVDVKDLCATIRKWTVRSDPWWHRRYVDQLVCKGKTKRGSIEPSPMIVQRPS
jgi:hypothetical protein